MDIDADRLLVLVEARPAIYNFNLKDHYNQDVVCQMWSEIGEELNFTAAQCKSKWHSLRTAYTRYLREVKNAPSGSAAKKKKWYLADAMSFLENYAGPQRKMISKKNNTIKSSATEVVADSMAEYLKIVTAQVQAQGKSQESEDPTLTFFKSLVPDINKLNSRKQRTFKAKVMELLNSMLDSQEDSELYNSRGPLFVQTVYSSNSSEPTPNLSNNTSSSYKSHIRSPLIGRVNAGLPITEDQQQ